jgi:hypothetical protein
VDRDSNRTAIDRFFALPKVQSVLKDAGFNADQVRRATAVMSDDEQARLSARIHAAESDIAGGELKDSQITLIILAITFFAFCAILILAFK